MKSKISKLSNLVYEKIHFRIVALWMKNRESHSPSRFTAKYIQLFPCPRSHAEKMDILKKYGSADVWIESGTYEGRTAEYLANFAEKVHTVEPSAIYYEKSYLRLKKFANVHQYEGLSEEFLEIILERLAKQGIRSLNLWLDGHYSGGLTFYSEIGTPIVKELQILEKYLSSFEKTNLFVDDVRCFNPRLREYCNYPDIQYLKDFAKRNLMNYKFKKDIFIAYS